MELVILLHGLGRTHRSMASMARFLRDQGYQTLCLHYQSLKKPFEELAIDVARMIDASPEFHAADKVHFVTHSMGGIITRHYLHKQRENLGGRMGSVVMLGPPNGGSEIADFFKEWWIYKILFGPAGWQLGVSHHDKHLPDEKITYSLYIIAGTSGWLYPDGWFLLKGQHDGRVSVESTKHPAMKDHVTVPILHGFLMYDGQVKARTAAYLKNGVF